MLTTPRCSPRTSRCCSTRSVACSAPSRATRRRRPASSTCTTSARLPAPEAALLDAERPARPRERLVADGNTFYASSTGGQTLVALDVSDPTVPKPVFTQAGVNYHGLRLSPDGRRLYVANIGNGDGTGARFSNGGLRIVDVSEIQDRKPDPQVHVLSDLTWPEHSIPQVSEPFTRHGRELLLEVDEYANYDFTRLDQSAAPVGAARIIDVTRPRAPFVVSDLRLQVHQPEARQGPQANDPGAALPVQGYAGHYCSVPRRRDPRVVACSMILTRPAGLRHPRPAQPRRGGLLQQAVAGAPARQPDRRGCLRDVPARVGRAASFDLVHRRQHRLLRRPAHQRGRTAAGAVAPAS